MHPTLCLGFQVHHPLRFTQDGHEPKAAFEQMAQTAYLPFFQVLNKALLDIPHFQCYLSLSGMFLQHALNHKELFSLLDRVISTGRVEIITEPAAYRLSQWDNQDQLINSIFEHHKIIREYFNIAPQSLRLLKRNNWQETATIASCIGFQTILLDGSYTDWGVLPQTELSVEDKLAIGSHAPLNQEGKIIISHTPANILCQSNRLKNDITTSLLKGVNGKDLANYLAEKIQSGSLECVMLDIEDLGTSENKGMIFENFYGLIKHIEEKGIAFHLPKNIEFPNQELSPQALKLVITSLENIVEPQNDLQKAAQKDLLETFELLQELEVLDDILMQDLIWSAHPQHFWEMLEKNEHAQDYFEEYIDGLRKMRETLQ